VVKRPLALTPQITLTITLDDLQGNDIGAVGNPAFVEIALAGFGPTLPRIAGTSMLAKVGPASQRIPYEGEPIEVSLWGNDVITPAGTYYVITIFDDQLNILQSGAYVFNGTLSADLSTLPQAFPSAASSVMGSEVTVQPSATPEFNCGLVNGPVEFYMLLTEDVSSSTLLPNFAGQIVIFRIVQNATAGWSFAWPANVLNPGPVATAAPSGGYLGASVQAFCVASDGNAYPLGPMTYN
jgi:hypothetical protein